ncbi:BPI protein, partial [Pterocles burchelli]|nr:BPI protein [Pterocles burchelli]
AHQQGIAVLEKELAQLKLPDISGDSRIRPVGKVHYEISSLELRNFHLPYSRISLVPNVGLQVSISNAFAEVSGNWRVKLHFIRASGSFDLTLENIHIRIDLRLGRSTAGRPTVEPSDCSTSISNVQLRFSGKLSWFYNLFRKLIASRIRKTLESKQIPPCPGAVPNATEQLSQGPRERCQQMGWQQEHSWGSKTFSAVLSPGRRVALGLRGDLGCFLPLLKPPVPSIGVSVSFSTFELLPSRGALTLPVALLRPGLTVLPLQIPSDTDIHLSTSLFAAFIPQLEEMYPNMPMKLRLSAPFAPFLTIRPGGVLLQPVLDIQAYAILPNSSLAPLFRLSLTGNVSAIIDVRSGRIVGNLTVGSAPSPALLHAKALSLPLLSAPQVRTLQSIMNIVTSSILLPRLNARLDQGFPLPLPARIQLSKILVQFHQNLLLLGANVHYQPR